MAIQKLFFKRYPKNKQKTDVGNDTSITKISSPINKITVPTLM